MKIDESLNITADNGETHNLKDIIVSFIESHGRTPKDTDAVAEKIYMNLRMTETELWKYRLFAK
jgi:hypothetical protein